MITKAPASRGCSTVNYRTTRSLDLRHAVELVSRPSRRPRRHRFAEVPSPSSPSSSERPSRTGAVRRARRLAGNRPTGGGACGPALAMKRLALHPTLRGSSAAAHHGAAVTRKRRARRGSSVHYQPYPDPTASHRLSPSRSSACRPAHAGAVLSLVPPRAGRPTRASPSWPLTSRHGARPIPATPSAARGDVTRARSWLVRAPARGPPGADLRHLVRPGAAARGAVAPLPALPARPRQRRLRHRRHQGQAAGGGARGPLGPRPHLAGGGARAGGARVRHDRAVEPVLHHQPPWRRPRRLRGTPQLGAVRVLHPEPAEQPAGEPGLLAVFDLANAGSVPHLLTEDLRAAAAKVSTSSAAPAAPSCEGAR